jgi:hypothetical protein
MLPLDLIHNLDTIAFEGWEYHKLPLEELLPVKNNQGNWDLPPKTGSVVSPFRSINGKSVRAQQNSVSSLLYS